MRLTRNTLYHAAVAVFDLLCAKDYEDIARVNESAAIEWRRKKIQEIGQTIKSHTKP